MKWIISLFCKSVLIGTAKDESLGDFKELKVKTINKNFLIPD